VPESRPFQRPTVAHTLTDLKALGDATIRPDILLDRKLKKHVDFYEIVSYCESCAARRPQPTNRNPASEARFAAR